MPTGSLGPRLLSVVTAALGPHQTFSSEYRICEFQPDIFQWVLDLWALTSLLAVGTGAHSPGAQWNGYEDDHTFLYSTGVVTRGRGVLPHSHIPDNINLSPPTDNQDRRRQDHDSNPGP